MGILGSLFGCTAHVIVYPVYLGGENTEVPGGKMALPGAQLGARGKGRPSDSESKSFYVLSCHIVCIYLVVTLTSKTTSFFILISRCVFSSNMLDLLGLLLRLKRQ